MGRVKFGSLVTDIKGKVGGQIIQGGRSGAIIRNRRGVKGKGELIDAMAKDIARIKSTTDFSTTVKEWSKLKEEERASWNNLVGVYTFVNKFGDVYNGTPYQIFTAVNLILARLNIASLTEAPFEVSALNPDGVFFTDTGTGTVIDNVFTIGKDFDFKSNNVDADRQYIAITASQIMAPSQAIGQAKFKTIETFPLISANLKKLADELVNRWNSEPISGGVFYVKTYTTLSSYPKKQFETMTKITITT